MADHTFTAKPDSLEIVTTYTFNAPRERVFEAYNDPALTESGGDPKAAH